MYLADPSSRPPFNTVRRHSVVDPAVLCSTSETWSSSKNIAQDPRGGPESPPETRGRRRPPAPEVPRAQHREGRTVCEKREADAIPHAKWNLEEKWAITCLKSHMLGSRATVLPCQLSFEVRGNSLLPCAPSRGHDSAHLHSTRQGSTTPHPAKHSFVVSFVVSCGSLLDEQARPGQPGHSSRSQA